MVNVEVQLLPRISTEDEVAHSRGDLLEDITPQSPGMFLLIRLPKPDAYVS